MKQENIKYRDDSVTLYCCEALAALRGMPSNSVAAIVTDPPYSSGGMFRGDRSRKTSTKYSITGTAKQYPEFSGDNMDQRSFTRWMAEVATECRRVCKPGGVFLCFTDWRQLPALSDAIQMGGWIWRGIVPWDKTEGCRPQKGWFRAQCEYVLSATNGPMTKEQARDGACLPGVYRCPVGRKVHQTGKPVGVLENIMRVIPAGSTVLDPFAGGGSTLLAARKLGLLSLGFELSEEYCDLAGQRLAQE